MARSSDISRLEHKIKRFSTLIEVNGLISSSLNLDQIIENVLTISKKVMNADASSLMLIDEKTNELVYEVALGMVGEKLAEAHRRQP
ncbi:MAG TPA: hypothetical protein VFG02_10155 [Nitrospirota bacterium]|nr:hypothetical protein [Nitrospirota bacterium]